MIRSSLMHGPLLTLFKSLPGFALIRVTVLLLCISSVTSLYNATVVMSTPSLTSTKVNSSDNDLLLAATSTVLLSTAASRNSSSSENCSSVVCDGEVVSVLQASGGGSYDALLYIVVVLAFYAVSMLVLMVKYVRRENRDAQLAFYFSEFIKRDRFTYSHSPPPPPPIYRAARSPRPPLPRLQQRPHHNVHAASSRGLKCAAAASGSCALTMSPGKALKRDGAFLLLPYQRATDCQRAARQPDCRQTLRRITSDEADEGGVNAGVHSVVLPPPAGESLPDVVLGQTRSDIAPLLPRDDGNSNRTAAVTIVHDLLAGIPTLATKNV